MLLVFRFFLLLLPLYVKVMFVPCFVMSVLLGLFSICNHLVGKMRERDDYYTLFV